MRPAPRIPALFRAVGFALAMVLVYLAFVWTRVGQKLDAVAFVAAGTVASSPVDVLFSHAQTAVVVGLGALAGVAGAFALIQRRLRAVSMASLLVVASVGLARALRAELPRPYLGDFAYGYNSLPSGHTAAAAALVVALLVLLPVGRASLTLTAGATIVITFAGLASVLSFAHRPSDVFAAIFIVGCLGSLLRLLPEPRALTVPRYGGLWTVGAAAAAVLLYACLLAGIGLPRELSAALAPAAAIFSAAAWVLLLAVPAPDEKVSLSSAPKHGPTRRLPTAPYV
jgi:hypothetical protein